MAKHVLLLFTTWLLSVCAYDVHKHMTIEEIRSTFHVASHDLVPEYEVVDIHQVTRTKRSIETSGANALENSMDSGKVKSKFDLSKSDRTKLRLTAFGRPVHLNLVPNPGLFKKGSLKVWTVEPNATSQHGVEYVELPETNESIGEVYQDEENQAAILLRNDEGALLVEGNIGSDLIIRPLPSRLKSTVKKSNATQNEKKVNQTRNEDDDEMFLDADGELSAEVAIDTGLPIVRKPILEFESNQHIVYRRKQHEEQDAFSDYAFMEPDHLAKRFRRSIDPKPEKPRKKREAPYTIYPEILVIVDYDGYRLHDGNNVQIKRYFVSFWNGVDLRYKLLKGPKIRISIAGIIISRGRDATPYLERNRVGRDAIDSAAALTDMGKYLFRERRLPVYDIAVAITKYDMCRRRKGGRCTKGTAGFAYVGGACVVNKRLEKVNSVAIIEDTGGFSGIIVAAHEVGHLLGAVHDGSPPPSYLGGPGAEKCQWTDGYIMSDLRHTERGFRWSTCSVASFHHFLNGDTATCLYNAPHEDESLPRVLPGKLLSLDAQCRRDRGTSACFKDDRVCAQLFCFDAGSGYCVAYRPAAEGSSCGDGQYCLNGRCVAEHENIIPDYSQNTPSYVRRDGSQPNAGRPLFENEENTNHEQAPPPQQPPNIYPQQYTTSAPYLFQYQYQSSPPQSQSTQSPYNPQDNYYSLPNAYTTQSTTTQYYSFSTTRSPYDFQYFSSQPIPLQTEAPVVSNQQTTAAQSPSSIPTQSTVNPYIGNYYILIQQTTKNPYNFANFGKVFPSSESPFSVDFNDNINSNYLKRSYNSASFYMDSSNVRNTTTTNLSRKG